MTDRRCCDVAMLMQSPYSHVPVQGYDYNINLTMGIHKSAHSIVFILRGWVGKIITTESEFHELTNMIYPDNFTFLSIDNGSLILISFHFQPPRDLTAGSIGAVITRL
jgi:hypothetical protein